SRAGLLNKTTIGEAAVVNARMRDIFDFTKRLLEEDPLFLLTADSKKRFAEEQNRLAPVRGQRVFALDAESGAGRVQTE
ncbi:MAG: hypothetical protein QG656_2275, partial [Candidatus Hydrogenedentes bacterium]|nr:hypothetical protein [Candidatus Hydrogenedentota bacterium]